MPYYVESLFICDDMIQILYAEDRFFCASAGSDLNTSCYLAIIAPAWGLSLFKILSE